MEIKPLKILILFFVSISTLLCFCLRVGVTEENQIGPSQVPLRIQPLYAFFQHMYNGIFNEPMGVFFDSRNREVYVADTKNDLIGIFNSKGVSLFSFGANDDIKEPVKVITDSHGRIYILDVDRSKVKVYNYRGEFLKYLDPPELQGKVAIATMTIDHQDNLYIAENGSSQILVFDPQFKLKLRFGGRGESKGQFQSISGIAVDKTDQKIYVTDSQAIPVQVFDRNGIFLQGWGEHSIGAHNFSLPGGIAVDSKGRVFVVDTLRQDLKIFDQGGNFIQRFGGLGNRLGEVAYPVDIAIDPSDQIYVVEKVGRRVQVFQEREIFQDQNTGSGEIVGRAKP